MVLAISPAGTVRDADGFSGFWLFWRKAEILLGKAADGNEGQEQYLESRLHGFWFLEQFNKNPFVFNVKITGSAGWFLLAIQAAYFEQWYN